MMIKDFIVIDNVLSDPHKVLDFAKTLEYHKAQEQTIDGIRIKRDPSTYPIGAWRGFRTDLLYDIAPEFSNAVFSEVISKMTDYNVSCEIFPYFHIAPAFIGQPHPSWWHIDRNYTFAGVIYLNREVPKDCGTSIIVNDQHVYVDNVFNRLVMYNAQLLHRPEGCFGDSVDNSRLTLTFFVNKFNIAPVA
jgi:hypothetical protein